MNNYNFYITILFVSIFTLIIKVVPIYFKLPENNKYINTFFDVLPISILTILALPEVFTSVGKSVSDIIITIIAMICVSYFTYKKKNLILIVFGSLSIVLILKEIINYGSF